jgi:Yip1 domain
MNCPKCSSPIAENSRFCGTCGTAADSGAIPIQRMSAPPPMTATIAAAATAGGPQFAAPPSPAEGIFERIKNILLTPKTEWPVIAAESTSPGQISIGYVLPLTALVAVISLLRVSVIGTSLPFAGTFRSPLMFGLESGALTFVASFIGVWLVALIINGLAPTFGGTRDLNKAFRVSVYSLTPAYAASVLALSPVLPTLLELLAGLYGIYVLYLGLPVVMRSQREKAVGYTATVIICTILVSIVLEFGVFGLLRGPAGFGTTGMLGGMRGTDSAAAERGAAAAGLTAALTNLAKAGEQAAAPSGGAANNGAQTTANPAAQTGATAAASGSDSAQNPAAAVGGLMSALGGAMGGDHRVEVVDFKTLTAALPPTLPGMKRTVARGESHAAMGMKSTSATGTYRSDSGAGVQIEITDMSAVSGLMDAASAVAQNTTSESDSGFEKNVVINGHTVHEKYDSQAKHGEITVLLVKRFQVDVTGDGTDLGALEQSFGQIDLARLESMKDVGR